MKFFKVAERLRLFRIGSRAQVIVSHPVDSKEGPKKRPESGKGTQMRKYSYHGVLSSVSWATLEALNISNTDIEPCHLYNLIVRHFILFY